MTGAHLTPEQKQAIADDLSAGMTVAEVVRKHKSAFITVRKIRDALEIPAKGKGWRGYTEQFVPVRRKQTFDAHGNLRAESVETKAPPGPKFEPMPGLTIGKRSTYLNGQEETVGQWIIESKEGRNTEDLVEAVKEAFKEFAGTAPIPPAPTACSDDLMTLYPLADLHLNLKAWRDYSGEDYNLDIAFKLATESVSELIDRSPPAKVGIILGLGDIFHQNDSTNATPASKHRLDTDVPWPDAFEKGISLLLVLIGYALRKHETVIVELLPGNHDVDAVPALCAALRVFHQASDRVRIGNGRKEFWYHEFGLCLLGGNHGHKTKPDRMAMALATDQAEAWGRAKHRHFFFAHIHHETAKEVGPVRVESFQSPAAKDGYSYGHAYRSGRSYTGITFHKTRGELMRNRVNITGA